MNARSVLPGFYEKLPSLLRLYTCLTMILSVLWLMAQGRTRAWLMSSMVVIGGAALAKLNDMLPGAPGERLPSLGSFVVTMYCRWAALLIWFRVSLILVGWEASYQNPIPLLMLCYALSAMPIPFTGLASFPALEIGAHISIFLSLLLVVSMDGVLAAANVLFFLVGAAALMITVKGIRGELE